MFSNAPKRQEIRKVQVTIRKPVEASASKSSSSRHDSPLSVPRTTSSKSVSPAPRPTHSSSNLRAPLRKKDRYLSPQPSRTRPTAPLKRKAQNINLFDSSSDEDESSTQNGGSEPFSAKRPKPSPGLEDLEVPDREIFRIEPWTEEDESRWPILQGKDMTGAVYAKRFTYKPVFEVDDPPTEIELRFPSNCPPEKYTLVEPVERDEYSPLEDIVGTIHYICENYLPESQVEEVLDDSTGFERRIKRAIARSSLEAFKSAIRDFNETLSKGLEDGTIPNHLKQLNSLPLSLVERILSDVYSRTVSPDINLLKQYENGTSNVYGELLPRFSHKVFQETGLRKDHVFVDLGSGVGNVVLQAALEVGCESWGIEMMPNPASLAAKQLTEFEARCKRWSIVPGKAHVITGDFLASPDIDAALRRADVILINNQAFTPDLNTAIVMKLLDVKEGTKIISLKSFVPDGWEIKTRTLQDPRNLLTVVKKEYVSRSVSWKNDGGEYFIATKDSSRIRRFMKANR